jgi:hypothetical protein
MGGIDPTIPPLSGRRAQAALADHGDPGAAFAGFLARVVDADTHAFTLRLAGTFPPPPTCTTTPNGPRHSPRRCYSAPRPPGRSAPTWTPTTSPSSSSSWPRSASATPAAPASSATATWGCCWTPCAAPPRPRCPAPHPPGPTSAAAGTTRRTADRPPRRCLIGAPARQGTRRRPPEPQRGSGGHRGAPPWRLTRRPRAPGTGATAPAGPAPRASGCDRPGSAASSRPRTRCEPVQG